jgi:uncharacterized damage-inducible protein DinB
VAQQRLRILNAGTGPQKRMARNCHAPVLNGCGVQAQRTGAGRSRRVHYFETMTDYLPEARRVFAQYKALGERAIEQLDGPELLYSPDAESNSVATIVKHMAGNMRSRWTDFLTTDGEKPDRNRDTEFEMSPDTSKETVLQWWETGWSLVFAALDPLTEADLAKNVTIRGEQMSALEAISRQVGHYAYHVGQIVFVAKMVRGSNWKTLSIARGKSEAYTGKLKFS